LSFSTGPERIKKGSFWKTSVPVSNEWIDMLERLRFVRYSKKLGEKLENFDLN
jgi:hypothetical protein